MENKDTTLQDEILDILLDGINIHEENAGFDKTAGKVSKEVQDIAIEFAMYNFQFRTENKDWSITHEELFNQFITDRYKG